MSGSLVGVVNARVRQRRCSRCMCLFVGPGAYYNWIPDVCDACFDGMVDQEIARMTKLLDCYCDHCWRPFLRAVLVTSLCGACEDESHRGMPEMCAVCTDNALDGTQRRLRVRTAQNPEQGGLL